MAINKELNAFQFTVITLYNYGRLDASLLDTLASYYRASDIDPYGFIEHLPAYDGLELDMICITVIEPGWYPERHASDFIDDPEQWEEEKVHNKFADIMHERWGWR